MEEEKYRLLVENTNDIIAVIQNGVVKYVNPAAIRITGYSVDELKSKPFFELIHPDDRQIAYENYMRRLKGSEIPRRLIYRIIDKDGNIKWIEINCVSIRWDDKPAILYICTDITKRKEIEDALKESEEMYRNLVKASYDAVLVIDSAGNIIDASESTLKLLRLNTSDEIIGKNVKEFIYPEDQEKAKSYFQRALKTGSIREMEIKILKKDNTVCIGEINAFMVRGAHGHSKYIVVVNDITERKRIEEDMKRRLMKFNLNEGEIYLVKEPLTGISIEAFNDLLNVGCRGIVISRSPEEYFRKKINMQFEFFWLGEIEGAVYPDVSEIEGVIEKLSGKHVVLIDRMDYIIFKNGFKRTLEFVQNIRDIAYFDKHIIILSIDPSVLSSRELKLIEKEVKDTRLMLRIKLSEGLLNVLRYIYRKNNQGIRPVYTEISKELGISKPTVRKRVKSLITHGYIREDIIGRTKYLELTDKGWYTFLNV
jgi:PAS domain S-box-containing protein